MDQSSLRQFYAVRKRPHAEHAAVKRRKLTEESRLDIPIVGEGCEPESIPISTRETVLTSSTSSSYAGVQNGDKVSASNSTVTSDTTERARLRRAPSRSSTRQARYSTRGKAKRKQKTPPPPSVNTALHQPTLTFTKSTSTSSPSSSITRDEHSTSNIITTIPESPPHDCDEHTKSPNKLSLGPNTTERVHYTSNKPLPTSLPTSVTNSVELLSTSQLPTTSKLSTIRSAPHQQQSYNSNKVPDVNGDANRPTISPPVSPKLSGSTKMSENPFPQKTSSPTKTLPHSSPRRRLPHLSCEQPHSSARAQLLPPSPKLPRHSPKQPFPPPSSSTSPSPSSSATLHPPRSSRKNLTKGFQKASLASPKQTPPSTKSVLRSTETPRRTRSVAIAETPLSRKSVASIETLQSAKQSRVPTTRAEIIRSLCKLSAKELARPTEAEERVERRRRRTRLASREEKEEEGCATQKGPQLHKFKSFAVESPQKSPSKQPAYQRFHNLAQPVKTTATEASPDLPLPYKYQVLSEKFRCTDTVVTMLQKRREICTFDKLKPAVEEMTRRKYENRNLAQMKTVYPNAYLFRQEKNIPGVYDRRKYESYQLTVDCNVKEDGRGGEGGGGGGGEFLDSSALLRRRKRFNKNLTEIVMLHHKEFLGSLKPPLAIPEDKVLRWHPSFQLDCIPDVEEAVLPSPPFTECYTTAQDVLTAAHERLAPRVRQALGGVASGSGARPSGPATPPAAAQSAAEINPALRGVSQTLLEKIQKKEASRAHAAITRDPVKEKKLEMLPRLGPLCRIIRTFFISEKKAAILWDSVVQKLSESHASGLPPDRVEEHLYLLKESLPGWLSVVEIRKRRFVKIDKNRDLRGLITRLDTLHTQLLA